MSRSLDPLLRRLQWKDMSYEQKKYTAGLPLYELLREPTHFNEFDKGNYSIWRDNETVICICDKHLNSTIKQKSVLHSLAECE
jgi:hypothetical protein